MKRSVKWEAGAYIWITVASPDRDPYKIKEEHHLDCSYFQEWLYKTKIRIGRINQSGGGKWDGLILLDDWPKVEKWLEENGYEQGSTTISKKD